MNSKSPAIEQAARLIREGCLVAFPTETVYGLGADATNGRAVARIYEAKGRPLFNPLIIHCADTKQAEHYAIFDTTAHHLAEQFWPGPLTLVLPLKNMTGFHLSELVTTGLDTVAIRVPSHPIAHAVIQASGVPIAAPSANISGRISATEAHHVHDDFGNRINMVLDGGRTKGGLESTIITTGLKPVLLRAGAIARDEIETALGQHLTTDQSEEIHAPGQMHSHYAPRLELRMNATTIEAGEALLAFGPGWPDATLNLSPTSDLREAAANLFSYLRKLDDGNATGIAVTPVPQHGLGEAINDRLKRASAPR